MPTVGIYQKRGGELNFILYSIIIIKYKKSENSMQMK